MKSNAKFALVLSCFVTVAGIAWATAMLNVTANIYNYASNNLAYTLQSDGSNSAVYTSGAGVNSYISPNSGGMADYQWNLDLSSSSRSFVLTLTPVNGSAAGPFATAAFNGVLHSRCFGTNSSTNVNWTTIQPGYPDSNCAMRANFTYNDVAYTLVMSPEYPGTGTATVSCTNWNSKSRACTAWNDVPTAGLQDSNVASLYSGNPGSQSLAGTYALTFHIVVSNP